MDASDLDLTRRRIENRLGTLLSVPLAGCTGDDGEPAGTETEPGPDTPTETGTESGTTRTETETTTASGSDPRTRKSSRGRW